MTTWFRTAILATGVLATLAIGLASATIYQRDVSPVAAKTDRLPTVIGATNDYMIVETRGEGVSLLSRVSIDNTY